MDSKTKHLICKEIWQLTDQALMIRHPYFTGLLEKMPLKPGSSFGTDGKAAYFPPDEVIQLFRDNAQELEHVRLHMMFHVLYIHLLQTPPKDGCRRLWNLACDIAAEELAKRSGYGAPAERGGHAVTAKRNGNGVPAKRSGHSVQAKGRDGFGVRAEDFSGEVRPLALYQRLWDKGLTEEEISSLESVYQKDSHSFWQQADERALLDEVSRQWDLLGKDTGIGKGGSGGGLEGSPGFLNEEIKLRQRGKYDFKTYLKRFAVFGEEMELDTESFDYIPYMYGLEQYGNMPLIEHLEYREVRKLEELVIAIDTSGSCSVEIVRRFMEETYGILSDEENFFQRMNVYILQCDFMVQHVAHITCEEEWKAYLDHLEIHGRTGTDFRPVFAYVEELRRKRSLKKLKGLLYFTDGDGIYPQRATDYETAFVFYHEKEGHQRVPAWAVQLKIDD